MKRIYDYEYNPEKLLECCVEEILIKTNVPELYKELLLFFTPFFRVSRKKEKIEEEISAILINHEDYLVLNSKMKCMESANFLYGGKKNGQHYFFRSYKCVIEDCVCYFFPELLIIYFENELGKKFIYANSGEKLFQFIRRLLRSEFLYPNLIKKGYMPLHGACVTKNNKAIAFLGESGAGKTSAILPLVEYFGYDLISSDLLFISKEGHVIGTPEKMRITPVTLKQYSPKYDFLINSTEKIAFLPSFFSLVFGCNIVSNARLDAIILPEINANGKENKFDRNNSQLDLREYISPFFYSYKQSKDVLWNGNVYQLKYNGDVKKLVELYKDNEVIK